MGMLQLKERHEYKVGGKRIKGVAYTEHWTLDHHGNWLLFQADIHDTQWETYLEQEGWALNEAGELEPTPNRPGRLILNRSGEPGPWVIRQGKEVFLSAKARERMEQPDIKAEVERRRAKHTQEEAATRAQRPDGRAAALVAKQLGAISAGTAMAVQPSPELEALRLAMDELRQANAKKDAQIDALLKAMPPKAKG